MSGYTETGNPWVVGSPTTEFIAPSPLFVDSICFACAECRTYESNIPTRMRLPWLLFLALFALSPELLLAQQEAFDNYTVNLTVNADGSLDVTETITVTTTGNVVKRGITRSFPLRSQVEDTRARSQSYTNFSVRRDGREEPFHTDKNNGYLTLYAGERDVFLDPGTYTYEISYRSPDQVYFSETIDEISWTAIGTENALPVRQAAVTVRVAAGVTPTQWACYTGSVGSQARDCTSERVGSVVRFQADGPLPPGQGLTVAVGWPTGFVEQPEPPGWAMSNGGWIIGFTGLLGALFYAFNAWQRYGQDPPSPPVQLRFSPPGDYSPAELGYLATGISNYQFVVASLVELAQKGYVDITETKKEGFFFDKEFFVLTPCGKVPDPGELPPEQQELYDRLLRDGDPIELDGKYNSQLQKAVSAHNKFLTKKHRAFLTEGNNGWKILPLVGILVATIVGTALLLGTDASGYALPLLILLGIVFVVGIPLFGWLIRKPTPEKLRLRAEIKGLKQYFSLSKKEHDQHPDAPEMTKEHYQQLLPYAIALGVDNNWSEVLAGDLLESMTIQQVYFYPAFGQRFRQGFASTAQPPSSSSSGGGGSVGSGGGGGGAGGW